MKDIKRLLPIGSVVLLKNGIKKLMVIGLVPYDKDSPDKIYDYIGVLYPEGFLGDETNFLFQHEDINDVIFEGYDNPERKAFLNFLDRAVNEVTQQSEDTQNDEG